MAQEENEFRQCSWKTIKVVVKLEGVLVEPAGGHLGKVRGSVQQVNCIRLTAKVVAVAEVLLVREEGANVAHQAQEPDALPHDGDDNGLENATAHEGYQMVREVAEDSTVRREDGVQTLLQ